MPVYPQSNLNPSSVPWGRAIQDATERNARLLENLALVADGNNRASAGQMGVVGRQINELGSRITRTISMSSVSVTATSTTAYSTSTGSVFIAGEGTEDRFALISVSGVVTKTGSQMSGPFITLRFGEDVVYRGAVGASGGGYPAGLGRGTFRSVFSGRSRFGNSAHGSTTVTVVCGG